MAKKVTVESAGNMHFLEDEELETIKSLLVYTLMKNTSLDIESIYSYIYADGKRILWN